MTEIHRYESIHDALLILETLLCHVKSLLHCHCEGDAQGKDKACEQEDDIDEVYVVGDAMRRAHESQALEVGETVVYERKQYWTKNEITNINNCSSNCFNCGISKSKG